MSNNKRPASSPPPGQPTPRPPPFAGAEPTPASVSEARVDPAVEELSVALKDAAEAFNKITSLLSAQQELLKSASRSSTSGGVFDSFRNSLKALTFVWNRSTPARLKAPNPACARQPDSVSTPLPPPPVTSGHSAATVSSVAHLPPRSYASAARAAAKSDPLSVAKVVATALPSSSPAEVIDLASKITACPHHRKPKTRRPPKGLSCSVTLRPSSPISPAYIPVDHQLEIKWRRFTCGSEAIKWQFTIPEVFRIVILSQPAPSDIIIPPLRSARWIPGIGFRFTFTSKPPPAADDMCIRFLTHPQFNSILQSQAVTFTAERFRFHNTVFYKRVALHGRCGLWTADHALGQISLQLKESSVWKNITIIGSPRLYVPPHTPEFGILYVDFYDDAKQSNLKALLRDPAYLGATGSLIRAREATNVRPAVQRCSICQR
ncbi:hypothetical protein BC629DRAFT_1591299 [Irpex lacteus]|nr:hypothetical protein BC629DRAFT_1591299 [Irpex lacteus]